MNSFIFISYARNDSAKLSETLDALKAAGIQIWIDRELSPGSNFVDAIYDKIEEATKVVGFWSSNAAAGKFVFREMFYADEIDKLIPVRIDSVALHRHFRSLHWLDLYKGNSLDKDALASLISLLPKANAKPGTRIRTADRQTHRHMMMGALLDAFVGELEKVAPPNPSFRIVHQLIHETVSSRSLLRTVGFTFLRANQIVAQIDATIDWKRANFLIDGVQGDDERIDLAERVRRISDQAALLWKQKLVDDWSWHVTFREASDLQAEIRAIKAKFNLQDAPRLDWSQ